MKKIFYLLMAILLVTTSCKDNDVNIFDTTADERNAEAIANLKNKLISPANGWRIKYRPEDESGSFWVLMKFTDEGTVHIQSDLGAEDGAYQDQTLTYRIDSSLGLELIIESYSFFAFLFEQNQAGFEAEYEFLYANETPEGELVFQSKSDRGTSRTIVLFEKAAASDESLLGKDVAVNLNIMADDIQRFSSSYKLTYENKDLILYLSMDELTRNLKISTASKKTNTATTRDIGFETPYIIEGDAIIFDNELKGTFLGIPITLNKIELDGLTDGSLMACGSPIDIHLYTGTASPNDDIILETSLVDANGKRAVNNSFMSGPIQYIFDNGVSQGTQVAEAIAGAQSMQLYHDARLNDGTRLTALGFYIQNEDNSRTFALKESTYVLVDNRVEFTFAPDFTIFESQETDANLENINIYLDKISEGNQTYIYEYSEGIFEFYNACNGWSFVFIVPED